ncbi:MAG: glycosyltransferase N-terminal domain-containing protein [Phycisphaeraceae bacterium]
MPRLMSLMNDVVYASAAAATSPLWAYRLLRTGKWRTDWAGRFGRCDVAADDPRPTLLLHAVSLGEVNAIRLLVSQLEQQHGDALRIVIATTTDTGAARAEAIFGERHTVVRYPLDFTRCVKRFLDVVQPTAVALVELEVWPNFVAECERRGVPVVVINGRLSARSYGRYRLIRRLIRPTFARLAAAAVQNETYGRHFVGLGLREDRLHITGTMKWDNAVLADDEPSSASLARSMGIDAERPLIVCGSTGPDEERMLVEQLATLRLPPDNQPPQILIAPRKPERFDHVAAELTTRFSAQLGPVVRRSQHPDESVGEGGATVFLLDTLGELRAAYALADLAVVGRSFCPMHGSDMSDPIALGKPTVIGPHVGDFRDMMDDLLAVDAIEQLSDVEGLPAAVGKLLRTDIGRELAERGRAVIRSKQGATQRNVALLETWLDRAAKTVPTSSS